MTDVSVVSGTGLPSGWKHIPLKHNLHRLSEKSNIRGKAVALENIESWTGRFIETDSVFDTDGVNFRRSDILFGKLRPYLAKVYLAVGDGEAVGDLWVLRPQEHIEPSFAAYQLLEPNFIDRVNGSTNGAKMPRAEWGVVGSIRVPTPPVEEQKVIVRFLDQQTNQIDGLITKKNRFIALLKEKRAAIITRAVTKGIDRDAPTRDSGQDWLGRVPAHWEVTRIAALLSEVSRPADPALPVLSVSIHDGVTDEELADDDRDRKVALSEDRTMYQGVEPGDLVYNMMRAWQGAFGAVTVKGLVSPAYVVAAPITAFRTKFIEHLLHTKSAAEETRRFSRGIADFRMRLYWEHFRALKVCMPPLEEQDRILSTIEAETTRIDGLIALTERSIGLLREKRSALITAAVTGQIDVRTAA